MSLDQFGSQYSYNIEKDSEEDGDAASAVPVSYCTNLLLILYLYHSAGKHDRCI